MSRVRSQRTALDGVRDSIDATSAAKDKSTVTGFIVERRFKDREIKFHDMTIHETGLSEQSECVQWQEWSSEHSVELHEPDTSNHLEATKSSCRRLDSLSAYRNVDAGPLPVIEDAPLIKAKGRLVIQSLKRADKARGLLLTDAATAHGTGWITKLRGLSVLRALLQVKHGETEGSLHFNLPPGVRCRERARIL